MKKIIIVIGLLSLVTFSGCKKYLEAKPDEALAIPSSVADLDAILRNKAIINDNGVLVTDLSCDDYYITEARFNSLGFEDRNAYTWENKNIFPIPSSAGASTDWSSNYSRIYSVNSVLDFLKKIDIPSSDLIKANEVKGQALFIRGVTFFQLCNAFCKGYNETTSSSDLGIPLRMTSDFNVPNKRSTLQETYSQILSDLNASISLLPDKPVHVLKPSKAAAYGVLARVYLSMRMYKESRSYADSSLKIFPQLLDYNIMNPGARFVKYNVPEVVYHSTHNISGSLSTSSIIDSILIGSYKNEDLRKSLFFTKKADGTYVYKSSYNGNPLPFDGVATDEMYLIRAECSARSGDLNGALTDLNTLLKNRLDKASFVPVTVSTPDEALTLILKERRKELIFRGLRWMDIKRLNMEGANITLTRRINNQTYTLPANSPRFATPIPDDIISLGGLPQNPY